MAQSGEEYLAVLKASYDYEPQSEDEIAIKENQIVFLLEKTDDDWWKVKIKSDLQDEDSPSGLVPAAYVEQAEHTSVVKALYDYDAAAPGELSVREDETLMAFDREDDWILVQSRKEGGKAGFVPGNYVEESNTRSSLSKSGGGQVPEAEPEPEPEPEPLPPPQPRFVPPSPNPPARPASVYVDPADRVAQTPVKAQTDHIKTWAVSEVDKKGKKKKGTLGIGNGSLFFASESDKTPVQKWDTADVEDFTIERHKHILIDMGGRDPTKLHFNVGKEEIAETILTKLEDSKRLAISSAKAASEAASGQVHAHRPALTPPPRPVETSSPSKKNGVSVRFTEESPEIIPPRESSEEGDAEEEGAGDEQGGELATALYDFEGTGPDELSVQEGEQLYIVEKEGEEWWKCRNAGGSEGVVPASYLEPLSPSIPTKPKDVDDRAQRERKREEAEKKERESRELADRERKKGEQERAKAAAEAHKKRAAASEASKKQRQEATKRPQQRVESEQGTSTRSRSSANNSSRDSSSARTSSENKNSPPTESTRVWHDRSGQFRVEAALLGFASGKLRLHKVNGVVIEVPSEKMSVEDMEYVERLMKKKKSASPSGTRTPSRGANDDDDRPLALKRPIEATKRESQKKGPQTDWFEFFLSAGCDIDDCSRYANSFEKDKIDESLLPDITESTMRSLGLREGDIIRVNKVIQQKYIKPQTLNSDLLAIDEELAIQFQEEDNGKKATSPAPNLFAGPGGILKNNTQRRGRPQPSKTLPPSTVDLDAIGTASEQIKRTGSPLVRTGSPATAPSVQPPQRSSSAMATVSGFDDDAWTNRPGSKPPIPNPTPPASVPPRATSVPPVPLAAAAPPAPVVPSQGSVAVGSPSLAKTTEADIFDQLARLGDLKTNRAVPSLPATPSPSSPVVSPPPGYNTGLGMGPSPTPVGQHFQNQQFGMLPPPQQNGARGPYAPVPANQGLLHPLVPTQTGFNGFVATRPSNVSPFQPQPQPVQSPFLQPQVTGFPGNPQIIHSQPQSQPAQSPFLQPQVTGFPGNPQIIHSQPTGFPASGPILTQPTGVGGGPFGGFTPTSAFPNTAMPPVQTNPTGFSPFGQSPFNNVISIPSPAPPNNSSTPNTSPANIFAQMKSGTFASGNEHAVPQQAGRYDALRANPQPTGWVAQPTGWGIQPNAGFQNGYTGY